MSYLTRFTPKQKMALLSIAAALLTLALKFFAYFLTESIGLYSDALETLINLAASFMVLWVVSVSAKPPDEKHAYGHDKAEYFSSGVEGGLIFLAGISIVYLSVERLIDPKPLTDLFTGVIISLIASLINFVSAYYIGKMAKQEQSITLEANAKHLMSDVWTSVAVALGLMVVSFLPPAFQVLDPLIGIAVALLLAYTGFDLLKRSIDGFMDAALPADEIWDIESMIQNQLQAPEQFMSLRTRQAGAKRFIEFIVQVDPLMTVEASHALCDKIEASILSRFPSAVILIHVEPLNKGALSFEGM